MESCPERARRGARGAHERLDAAEQLLRDDRREGVLDAHGRGPVAGVEAPQQRACVDDVGEPGCGRRSSTTADLPPKNRTEHRVRESVQVREKGERNEQAEAVRS